MSSSEGDVILVSVTNIIVIYVVLSIVTRNGKIDWKHGLYP